MSITAAVIVMIVSACVYAGVAFLNHSYNHGGRDVVDPLYSISQWDPNRWTITSSCVVPAAPGGCVIEGLTGAYQGATHWCRLPNGESCIDPDTGASAKANPVPMQVVCSNIPYCGWSKCVITFDGKLFVQVTFPKTISGTPAGGIVLSNVPLAQATDFYMERLAVSGGLVNDQNGTIARFYILPPSGDQNTYILSYSNNVVLPGTIADIVSALTVQKANSTGSSFLSMFVLMENMPTTISTIVHDKTPNVVARKILIFGGANRTQDPGLNELIDFNDHVQSKMWDAANKYDLTIVRWDATFNNFYGRPTETYARVLNGWDSNTIYSIPQDIVEERLALESKGSTGRAFYNWIG